MDRIVRKSLGAFAAALAIGSGPAAALDLKETIATLLHKDPKPRTAPCYAWELKEVKETVYDVTKTPRKERVKFPVIKEVVRDRTEVYTRPVDKIVLEDSTETWFPQSKEGTTEKVVHHVDKDEHGCWRHTQDVVTRSITCVKCEEMETKHQARKWQGVPSENKYTCRYLKQEQDETELTFDRLGYKPREITVKKWVRVPYFPPKACCGAVEAEPAETPEAKPAPKSEIKPESKAPAK
jgi:hypothetical protein